MIIVQKYTRQSNGDMTVISLFPFSLLRPLRPFRPLHLSCTLACAVAALALLTPLAAAFDVPPNDGFVTDSAGLLSVEQETTLEQMLAKYKEGTSNEIALVILESLRGEAIADVAVEIGRKWGVGTEEDDNGILLLIAYGDRQLHIATGYGLEGAVPDVVAKGIIEEEILPGFREGQYYDGILAGIESLQKHVAGEYTTERYVSMGGGGSAWWPFALFLFFIVLDWIAATLSRTKSWWLGGVLGVFFGAILTVFFNWWIAIPVLAAIGLFFDYVLSKQGVGRISRRGGWGGFGGSGRGGSGGFGGFRGGSFGGGGASGRW